MRMTQAGPYPVCHAMRNHLNIQENSRWHHKLRSMDTEASNLDSDMLSQYFKRIHLPADLQKDIMKREVGFSMLSAICMSHAQAIPFENLDLVSI